MGLEKDAALCSAPPNGCRHAQRFIWRTEEERLFSGDQVVGRQRPAHHQEYRSNIFGVTPRLWNGFLVWLL